MNSLDSPNLDHFREKATYSKNELISIILKIETIEKDIDTNWNKHQKALYIYNYIKRDIIYRKPTDLYNGKNLDKVGNSYRNRTWDTLIGLINQLSTCNGFAFIYQELLTRQNIECVNVVGKYRKNQEGSHAWNIVSIDDKKFAVDIISDALEYEKGNDITTGFGFADLIPYVPRSHKDLHFKLCSINQNWVKTNSILVGKSIPVKAITKEKIEAFIKTREMDKIRMLNLQKNRYNAEKLEDIKIK